MTIKEFCEGYVKASDKLKERYLKEKLKIKTYIPFIRKVALADNLVKHTVIDSKTGDINVRSDINYLLFCRIMIEEYTNLIVETEGFFEEYDLLNQSGILDIIISMIPEKELKELKMICDSKQQDYLLNHGTPKAFISSQVERLTTLLPIVLEPIINEVTKQVNSISSEDKKDFLDNIIRLANQSKK